MKPIQQNDVISMAPKQSRSNKLLKGTKKRIKKPSCMVCRQNTCIDENIPKAIFKINPGYNGRVTRSITKVLDMINYFILIEVYRCMPLLGDEQEKVPNWNVHIVHYAIIFTNEHGDILAHTQN